MCVMWIDYLHCTNCGGGNVFHIQPYEKEGAERKVSVLRLPPPPPHTLMLSLLLMVMMMLVVV